MNFYKIQEAFGHNVVGGSDFQWDCYGPNARYIDFANEYGHGSMIFDTLTKEVFEAVVDSNDEKHGPYSWFNPETIEAYKSELEARNAAGIYNPVYDVKYIDLELIEDFLEKAKAIFNGVEFDKRIQVPLEIEDDLFLTLAKEAHSRDITINKMVELVLQRAIDEHKSKETS